MNSTAQDSEKSRPEGVYLHFSIQPALNEQKPPQLRMKETAAPYSGFAVTRFNIPGKPLPVTGNTVEMRVSSTDFKRLPGLDKRLLAASQLLGCELLQPELLQEATLAIESRRASHHARTTGSTLPLEKLVARRFRQNDRLKRQNEMLWQERESFFAI